jgi:hypothetical protein
MHKDGRQIVETAVEARGGLLGRPVLLVLLVSCVLATQHTSVLQRLNTFRPNGHTAGGFEGVGGSCIPIMQIRACRGSWLHDFFPFKSAGTP